MHLGKSTPQAIKSSIIQLLLMLLGQFSVILLELLELLLLFSDLGGEGLELLDFLGSWKAVSV